LYRVEEVAPRLVGGDDQLAGDAGLGRGKHDARTRLGIEANHAWEVWMALDDCGGVCGDLLDIGARLFIRDDLHVGAVLGERIPQPLSRLDEVRGCEEGDGADLPGLEARILM